VSAEKAYAELRRPTPKPEKHPSPHRVTAFVGYCEHCDTVRGKGNVAEIVTRGKALRDELTKLTKAKYKCPKCGWPYPGSREEVEAVKGCYLCGYEKEAVPIE